MNDNWWFLVELVLGLGLIFGGVALTVTLARRWYMKHNGHERFERYANAAHRKVTLWFSFLMIPFLFIINLEKVPGDLILLVVLFPLFLLYMAVSTYLWKQESDNKDNYLYDWWSTGVGVVWLMLVMFGYQWWGM